LYPPTAGEDGGLGQFPQLAPVDEGLQDVLLHVVVAVDDLGHSLAEVGQILYVFVDPVVIHVIGGRFGSQNAIVAHILLGKAVAVMTADHRIGQVEIFDHGWQLPFILFGHLAAEDHGDLLRLSDASIQVQQSFREFVDRSAVVEDEVVAVFHLREEPAVLTAGVFAFAVGKEGRESGEPLLAAP
jgi:hypothetical protein